MSTPVVLAVTLIARPGEEDAMRDVLLRLAEHSRTEEGCVAYIPHVDPDDAARFVLYEHWADQGSFEGHRATDVFRRWAGVELKDALLRSEPQRLQPLESGG
jgi:quinol monooxygenase YgiN